MKNKTVHDYLTIKDKSAELEVIKTKFRKLSTKKKDVNYGIVEIRKFLTTSRKELNLQKKLVKNWNENLTRRKKMLEFFFKADKYANLYSTILEIREFTKMCLTRKLREIQEAGFLKEKETFPVNCAFLLASIKAERNTSWQRTLLADLEKYGYIKRGISFCSGKTKWSCYCAPTLKFFSFVADYLEAFNGDVIDRESFSEIDLEFDSAEIRSYEESMTIIAQNYLKIFEDEATREVDMKEEADKCITSILESNLCVKDERVELPLSLKGFKILPKKEYAKLSDEAKEIQKERKSLFMKYFSALQREAERYNEKHLVVKKSYRYTETGKIFMTISGRVSPTKYGCALTKKNEKDVYEALKLNHKYDCPADIFLEVCLAKDGKYPHFKTRYFKENDHFIKYQLDKTLDQLDENGKPYIETIGKYLKENYGIDKDKNFDLFLTWIYKYCKSKAVQYRSFFEKSESKMLKNLQAHFIYKTKYKTGDGIIHKVTMLEDSAITRFCTELCLNLYKWIQKYYNAKSNASVFVITSATSNFVFAKLRTLGIKVINKYDCYVTNVKCENRVKKYMQKFLSLFKITKDFKLRPKVNSRNELISQLVRI